MPDFLDELMKPHCGGFIDDLSDGCDPNADPFADEADDDCVSYAPYVEAQRDALPPMDEEGAEYYLRRRALLQAEIDLIKGQAEAKLSPIRTDLKRLDFLHEKRLETYVRERSAQDGKKTFAFWGGTCKLNARKPEPVLVDERAALAYAQENSFERFINPPSVRKDDYQKYAKDLIADCGEMPPGIDFSEERTTFSIQGKKGETF